MYFICRLQRLKSAKSVLFFLLYFQLFSIKNNIKIADINKINPVPLGRDKSQPARGGSAFGG
ncbi:MAG: hypothetical protein QME51_04440 [Planctomycetota bacterium]|nr:hypothetical protein [Planctomycetota bacterium]